MDIIVNLVLVTVGAILALSLPLIAILIVYR